MKIDRCLSTADDSWKGSAGQIGVRGAGRGATGGACALGREPTGARSLIGVAMCWVLMGVLVVSGASPLAAAPRQARQTRPAVTPAQALQMRVVGDSCVVTKAEPIVGAPLESLPLWQSARVGRDFRYVLEHLPKASAIRIELGFAELQDIGPGQRLMRVEIDGRPVLESLDVVAQAGGVRKAWVRSLEWQALGTLDLHFVGLHGEAFVNYIRIEGFGQEILLGPGVPRVVAGGQPTSCREADGSLRTNSESKPLPFGMPIGGIGTGSFELLADGSFANLTLTHSVARSIPSVPGTFLAVRAKHRSFTGEGRLLRVGRSSKVYANVAGMQAATYRASYPFAELEYEDSSFPLRVRLEAFSPAIPFDMANSSLPVAFLLVEVSNPNKFPVASAVAFSWQDVIGVGSGGEQCYGLGQWPVRSDAGSAGHLVGIHASCVESSQGQRGQFLGDVFVGTATTGSVVTRLLHWNPAAEAIPWWKEFVASGRLSKSGASPETWSASGSIRSGETALVICAAFNLAPAETRRIPFVLAWYGPRFVEAGSLREWALAYSRRFASSTGVALYAFERWRELEARSRAWRDEILESDLPKWLSATLLDAAARSAANSLLLDRRGVAILETVDAGSEALVPPALWLAATAWLRRFYPAELRESFVDQVLGAEEGAALSAWSGAKRAAEGEAVAGTGPSPQGELEAMSTCAGMLAALEGDRWTTDVARWAREWLVAAEAFLQRAELRLGGPAGTFLAGWPSPIGADLQAYKAMHATAIARGAACTARKLGQAEQAGLWAARADEWARRAEMSLAEGGTSPTAVAFTLPWAGDWVWRETTGEPLSGEAATSSVAWLVSRLLETEGGLALVVGQEREALAPPYLVAGILGAEAFAAGLANAGLELARRAYETTCRPTNNPWGSAFFVDRRTGRTVGRPNHATMACLWSLLDALVGVRIDPASATLFVAPRLPYELGGDVRLPVLTPRFHGALRYEPANGHGSLRVVRVGAAESSASLVVRRVVVENQRGERHAWPLDEPILLQEGMALVWDDRGCTATLEPKLSRW